MFEKRVLSERIIITMEKMEKSGFIGLISDKNKLSCIFNRENTTGQLGFAVLNDYFSSKLFPGISTLMPNLVYCYIIFSIIGVEKEEDLDYKKINEMLAEITTKELKGKSLANMQLGFHGNVAENVFGTYRGFMERYGFFEKDEQKIPGKLNKEYAEFKTNRKEKSRYKEIHDYFKNKQRDDIEISPALGDYEKRDMIQRCLTASGMQYDLKDNKGFIIRSINKDATPSLFDLAVLKYACLCKENNEFEYRFVKKTAAASETVFDIPVFESLGETFRIKINGKELRKHYPDLYGYYEAARFSTVMQYYIKCRSNQLIRAEKRRIRGESNESENDNAENLILKFNWEWNEEQLDRMTKLFEDKSACKDKMQCLRKIYESIKNNKGTDKIILRIIHESDSSGETGWNRGESTEYLDTYRWEYRPKHDSKDDSNIQNNNKQNKIFERKPGKNTKCASYFVGELCR